MAALLTVTLMACGEWNSLLVWSVESGETLSLGPTLINSRSPHTQGLRSVGPEEIVFVQVEEIDNASNRYRLLFLINAVFQL